MSRRVHPALVLLLVPPNGCTEDAAATLAEASEGSTTKASEATTMPTSTEAAATTAESTGLGTGSGTTAPTGGGCTDASECTNLLAPVCVEMKCVGCGEAADGDAACAAKDANVPACNGDGACVQCTATNPSACSQETPVCDPVATVCVGCTAHEQCPGSACELATGACFEDGCVVEVDGDGGADYVDIGSAVADGCVVVVHELDGDGIPYLESLTIDGFKVAIFAAPGESPTIQGTGGNPSLQATNAAAVYIDGLDFRGNTSGVGLVADGATLYLDRTQVIANAGGGLVVQDGADGHVRTSSFGGNGNSADIVAVLVASSSLDAAYTTMVGYDDGFGGGPALRCTDPVMVRARNSLLLKTGTGPEVDCPELAATFTATETPLAGEGNLALGPVEVDWLTADLHLNMPPAELLTVARWKAGDPRTDIDGDLRPAIDDTPDVAGADIPQ